LDIKAGTVIGRCQRRHRSIEFRAFLDTIEASVPADADVHVVLDNAATHKTRIVHDWLVKRPRFHLHFTPTSASLGSLLAAAPTMFGSMACWPLMAQPG
jgi:hypothetical protein